MTRDEFLIPRYPLPSYVLETPNWDILEEKLLQKQGERVQIFHSLKFKQTLDYFHSLKFKYFIFYFAFSHKLLHL